MSKDNRGFTLIELIVVMAVFTAVLTIAAVSFNTMLQQSAKLAMSEESNIEGVIGLEMLRHDLAQTGFGLPWSLPSAMPAYSEADGGETLASGFNETSGTTVPRAVIAGNDPAGVLADTDYLVLKGTTLGLSRASQRWTYVNYSSVMKPHQWASENLHSGDRVIVVKRSFSSSGVTNELVSDTTANGYYVNYSDTAFSTGAFSPQVQGDVYNIYGVDTAALRMPFNRADYFVSAPQDGRKPARCAAGTGTLYKGVVNQADGTLTRIPLLDCIADMQVVFGWDLDGDGLMETYSDADGSNVSSDIPTAQIKAPNGAMGTSDGIRGGLRLIRVYILAQEGKKDPFFTNSITSILVGPVGMSNLSHTYTLSSDQMNYRWKVYRIIVSPKNLTAE